MKDVRPKLKKGVIPHIFKSRDNDVDESNFTIEKHEIIVEELQEISQNQSDDWPAIKQEIKFDEDEGIICLRFISNIL